jgi:hypothetical protein
MLLSLPPSLISLLLCLLESRVLADSAPTPTPTALHIADYVASGFGINDTLRNPQITPSLESTGTGLEYASKCEKALSTWSVSSFWYGWDDAIVQTSTFSSGFTETHQLPGSTKVTSVITLCDGHPRIVGRTSVSTGNLTTSTAAWTNIYTESKFNSAYPTPPPCSIQPSDCKTMSSMYDSSVSSLISRYGQATIQPPVCTVTPSSSYSFSTDVGNGKTCSNCQIAASTARVMFWPITTGAGGDLCNSPGSTITASPTGPPNSFVTEGITITSPTVAISLGFMSRVDGCGTTINHTIIPVHPDQVTSVRGFRALFEHHRFNFADLNYFCMDSNKTMGTIPEGEGDSCYQQVPADAYFGGLNNAVVLDQAPFRNLTKEQLTIWDDYQPQLLPPATLTKAIASLWGNDCNIHPDGVWDPPIALTPEAAIVVPTAPGGGNGAQETGSQEANASPINSYQAQPPRQTGIAVPTRPSGGDDDSSGQQHFTALPETGGYGGDGSSGGQSGGSGSGQQGSGGGSNSGSQGSNGGSNGGSSTDNSGGSNGGSNSGSQGSSGGSGIGSNGGSNSGSQDSNGDSGSDSNGSGQHGSSGGSSGSSSGGSGSGQEGSSGNSGSGSNGGSSSASGNGQQGSDGSAGYGSNGGSSGSSDSGQQGSQGGAGSGSSGSSGLGSSDNGGSSGGSDSGSIGGSNSNGDGQNGDNGNDSGASNQGQGMPVMVHTTIITIGSKTLQATQNQEGAWVVPDASTTYTVSAGGSAVEVDAATFTAGDHGLVNMHTSVLTIGSKTLTGTQDASGAWIVPDGSTTHTISQSGSAVTVDAATLTAGSDGLVDMHATTTTIGGQIVTYSQDSNGAWIIPDGTTTHTVTPGASAFEMDGVTLTAGSGGLSDVHASKTGSNTRSSGASSTRGSQSTSTSDSNSESSASDSDASSAGHTTPRLTALALAFVALVFCAI